MMVSDILFDEFTLHKNMRVDLERETREKEAARQEQANQKRATDRQAIMDRAMSRADRAVGDGFRPISDKEMGSLTNRNPSSALSNLKESFAQEDSQAQGTDPAAGSNRRIKSGGFLRNTAGSALDRLSAVRRGKLPTQANAAESQRLRTGMSEEEQRGYVNTQDQNLQAQRDADRQGRQDAAKLKLTQNAPGQLVSDVQSDTVRSGQEQIRDENPVITGQQSNSTQQQTEQGQAEASPATEGTDQQQNQASRPRNAPLGSGKQGRGFKVPGWRQALRYGKENPGMSVATFGAPQIAAGMGATTEFLSNKLGNLFVDKTNPNVAKMMEYNPEIAAFMTNRYNMHQFRDIQSTEAIRNAYR